ncbi:MAG: MMPL family transporter, partial [Candidatus Dormibacteraeota bacterium]|nr:MMPL family transporter [Candidatus Dormibacteraeota bacterium]
SDYDVESVHGAQVEQQQLPQTNGSQFLLLFTNRTMRATDPAFTAAVTSALHPLRADHRVASIVTPFDAPAAQASTMVSTDQHSVFAIVTLNLDFAGARQAFPDVLAEVHSPTLSIATSGDVAVASDFDTILAADLRRSEVISLPLALVLLVIVFGTGIAALLCLGVGIFAVTGGAGAALVMAHAYDVSTYAVNVVTLIGLGIAIDYSLFIVTRFREELARDGDVARAIGVTMATAGRAVAFSGMTVALGLGGLLFYTGTPLLSMGVAGAIVVAISVIYALTFLPALLAILGPRVNRLRVPFLQPPPHGEGTWHRIAMWVMRRPWTVLVPTVAVLVLAGTPFLGIDLASTDVGQLPVDAPSRVGSELLMAQFPATGQNTIEVVMRFDEGLPTASQNVAKAYALSRRLAATPGVVSVNGYVNVQPSLTLPQYQAMYQGSRASLPQSVATELTSATGRNIAVLDAQTPFTTTSDQAHQLVRTIRNQDGIAGATVQVTGNSAFDVDFVDYMLGRTPLAFGFVMAATVVVLLLLLRSLALPLKAVLMNALSLSAAFGALVWIFQQGHLAGVLGFTPGSLDPTIPVLLFCIVFGLSMDYEVFLLTRMQEEWRRSGDNRRAVADGLERSGRLVTGAAAIMACVFLAFALASVVTIKSLGLGMAVAVVADATLVRALVVPALMRLLGNLNWWAPRWLRRRSTPDGLAPAA